MRIMAMPKNIIRYMAKGRRISGNRLIAAAPMRTPGMDPIPPMRTMQKNRHDSQKVKLSGDTHMSLLA